MNSTLYSRNLIARRIAAACGAGVLLVGATACGSSDDKDGASPTSSSTSGPQSTVQGQLPGANGKVAAVDGSTAQVQSQQNGQVAVTWTGATTFTKEVAASLADVEVGDCVMVTPADTGTSSDSADEATTEVDAGSVRITPAASDGTCTGGLRGGPGGGPGAGQGPSFNGTPPSGAPTNGPPSGSQPQVRGMFGAFGKVTAVSASGFTVSSVRPAGSGSADTETADVTVSTSGTTKYTATAKAAAADVKVGSCMAAQGKTDSTGAVTATTIALSAAVDGECGGGFFRSRGDGASTGSSTTTSGQES